MAGKHQKQIKTYYHKNRWKQLKDYIKEYDSSRKTSNAHFARLAFNIALEYLKEQETKRRLKAKEFRELKENMEGVING